MAEMFLQFHAKIDSKLCHLICINMTLDVPLFPPHARGAVWNNSYIIVSLAYPKYYSALVKSHIWIYLLACVDEWLKGKHNVMMVSVDDNQDPKNKSLPERLPFLFPFVFLSFLPLGRGEDNLQEQCFIGNIFLLWNAFYLHFISNWDLYNDWSSPVSKQVPDLQHCRHPGILPSVALSFLFQHLVSPLSLKSFLVFFDFLLISLHQFLLVYVTLGRAGWWYFIFYSHVQPYKLTVLDCLGLLLIKNIETDLFISFGNTKWDRINPTN